MVGEGGSALSINTYGGVKKQMEKTNCCPVPTKDSTDSLWSSGPLNCPDGGKGAFTLIPLPLHL